MVQSGEKSSGPRYSRRAILGGSVGAAALAFAYATFGDDLLDGSHGASPGVSAATTEAAAQDTNALDSEAVRVSHLLRRTGFGVTREEYDHYQAMGLDATIQEIVNYEAVDDSAAIEQASKVANPDTLGAAVRWWLSRILSTKRPLQEKLTFFWHGVLTSQISVVKDPDAMIAQNELLRANARGSFPDLLKAITADPAMMVYLDISGSTKAAPNENYARELMELFSLGEGNYSEEDVREGARAFTGWRVPRERNDSGRPNLLEPVFQARRFDDGSKSFLGQSGNFGPDDIIDIIVKEPASAAYITGRLFSFFVYPDPDPADLQPFIDTYVASGYSIGTTLEAMLRSDVFYSPRAYRAIVKSPVEYAVGGVKALNLQEAGLGALAGSSRQGSNPLTQMGQTPMEPPNVAGWPGGESWLNSATVFARLNFVDRLTSGNANDAAPSNAPGDLGTASSGSRLLLAATDGR